jgi:hypothetical protein
MAALGLLLGMLLGRLSLLFMHDNSVLFWRSIFVLAQAPSCENPKHASEQIPANQMLRKWLPSDVRRIDRSGTQIFAIVWDLLALDSVTLFSCRSLFGSRTLLVSSGGSQ